MKGAGVKPALLVLASTYPRWRGDPEPGFVHELACRLAGTFNVTVLCPHAPGAVAKEVFDGVQVIRFRYAPAGLETLVNDGGIVNNLKHAKWKLLLVPGFVLAQAWHAWRLIRSEGVDIMHAHWLLPQGMIAALVRLLPGKSVPYLVTSHGADLYALRGSAMDAMKRYVARRARKVTVVSKTMREELGRIGIPPVDVEVMPMGVDLTERFSPDSTVVRSDNELLFVGRLVEKKGLRHLLDAMPAILHAHPTAFLTVAGFGPEEGALRSQVERLGLGEKIRFVGAVGQASLPGLYRRAALFVAPFVQAASGDREGLGLVSVEAAGCGCPVVVSRLPAVRDVFAEGEAIFAEPADPASLAQAVIAGLAAPAPVPEHVREALVARFDWKAVAMGYARILRQSI